MVFVHGIGDHGGRHPHLIEALVSAGHTVFAPDMRGHGRSPGARGDSPSFGTTVRDLHQFVEHLRATAPAVDLVRNRRPGGIDELAQRHLGADIGLGIDGRNREVAALCQCGGRPW